MKKGQVPGVISKAKSFKKIEVLSQKKKLFIKISIFFGISDFQGFIFQGVQGSRHGAGSKTKQKSKPSFFRVWVDG